MSMASTMRFTYIVSLSAVFLRSDLTCRHCKATELCFSIIFVLRSAIADFMFNNYVKYSHDIATHTLFSSNMNQMKTRPILAESANTEYDTIYIYAMFL